MACSISDLIQEAAPFQAFSAKQIELAEIALLVSIVQSVAPTTDVSPSALLAQAACFECLSESEMEMAELILLCQISLA